MSCFNETNCTDKTIYENIMCNYTLLHMKYICNYTNTCQRDGSRYDCCADDIRYCTIELLKYQLLPTHIPTIQPTYVDTCETICSLTPSTNQCYWYESQNIDISCIGKNNKYCCSHSHNDCCQTYIAYTLFTFIIFFILFIICLQYKYLVYKHTQVIPYETMTDKQSHKQSHKQIYITNDNDNNNIDIVNVM